MAGDFATLYLDPPWPYPTSLPSFGVREGDVWKRPGSVVPYPTLSLGQIAMLPVRELTAKAAHIYLWTTNTHLPDALRIVREDWRLTYSTLLVWEKPAQGRKGFPTWPCWTEYLIFARRGTMSGRLADRAIGTNIYRFPRRKHSQKPPEFYPLIEIASPGPRCELFSRDARPGWTSWGNEVTSDPTVDVIMQATMRRADFRLLARPDSKSVLRAQVGNDWRGDG